jgi:hypothetical protein
MRFISNISRQDEKEQEAEIYLLGDRSPQAEPEEGSED